MISPKCPFETFAAAMAVLCQISRSEFTPEMMDAYYEVLGHYPSEVIRAAVLAELSAHQFNSIPTPGKLILQCDRLLHGDPLDSGEAYQIARRAIRRFGYYGEEEGLEFLRKADLQIHTAVCRIGWRDWCDSEFPESTRKRFIDFYTSIVQRETETRRLPETARKMLQESNQKRMGLTHSPEASKLARTFDCQLNGDHDE